jgi:hypothetical protein
MNRPVDPDAVNEAQRFMESHRRGQFAVDALDLVIAAALSPGLAKAREGTNAMFVHLIEPLSDTFLVEDRRVLEKVLAHLISRLRRLPAANELDQKLEQWGLGTEADLLNRMEHLSVVKTFNAQLAGTIKKVFLPSRVTLGADVLLSSLVIEKMKRKFPDAEIVFLGSQKNGSILQGNQAVVRIHPLHYKRRGDLLNRFLIWLELIRAIAEETAGLGPGEDYIIINTDSRLLQSGLLPTLPPAEEEKRYFFWIPSLHREAWQGTSQAEDLDQWLDDTFGAEPRQEKIYPQLHFLAEDIDFADKVYEGLNPMGKRFIVSMSLGVGGNKEKRVKHQSEIVSGFELGLVQKILDSGAVIILDKGYGKEELEQANALLQAVNHMGYGFAEVSQENPGIPGIKPHKANPHQIRVVAFQGTINKFAALIQRSDCYIGYDSLGQHVAAALGRDVITIFAGYASDLFPVRWQPLGKGRIHLVKAQSGPFTPARQDRLVDEVFELYNSLRKK